MGDNVRGIYNENGAKALVGNYLKGAIRKKKVTYRSLALKLRRWGWKDSPESIANRLSRGAFSAGFFITVLKALKLEEVELSEIERLGLKTEEKALKLLRARLAKKNQ
jgi:hypothetical protein